jgi:putative membrane protein
MKYSTLTIFAAAVITFGTGACSSTSNSTEDNTTTKTAESITSQDPSADARTREVNKESEMAADMDTTSFPVMAASSDMFEKLSSEMVQTRGSNQEVKTFAQHMITDHSKTTEELKSLTAKKSIMLPVGLAPMHQRMLNHLNDSKDTRKFDERYMEAQVMAHMQAVALYETASKTESDPDLKAFAAKTLPALRMHLDMAKKTKDIVD